MSTEIGGEVRALREDFHSLAIHVATMAESVRLQADSMKAMADSLGGFVRTDVYEAHLMSMRQMQTTLDDHEGRVRSCERERSSYLTTKAALATILGAITAASAITGTVGHFIG